MGRSHKQVAVMPYRVQAGHLEIALVSKSSGKGWTVPKGSLESGEGGGDAAGREAEEEAGLLGELTRRPIGRYRYSKQDDCYEVRVYVMRVTIVREAWLEAAHRRRRWMAVEEAVKRLRPELHGLVHETVRIVRSSTRYKHGPAAAHRTASPAGLW
jgi:8-oxo-dGTP pyrophosphatase MutT (NUDIX family)